MNVTPDSFSDGGDFLDPSAAVAHGVQLYEAGADWVDVGGESTRPGAREVPSAQELERVMPVIEGLVARGVPVSIDSRRPEVMSAAVRAGAGLINDVNALRAPGALEVAAACSARICLMHMQGDPATMQRAPRYADVIAEVSAFLAERIAACEAAGVARERLIVDPGFGFGKTQEHNLVLLAQIEHLAALGVPIMVGVSRKSMLGRVTGREPKQRVAAGLAAVLWAVLHGAGWVRTHDVPETIDTLKMLAAIRAAHGEAS